MSFNNIIGFLHTQFSSLCYLLGYNQYNLDVQVHNYQKSFLVIPSKDWCILNFSRPIFFYSNKVEYINHHWAMIKNKCFKLYLPLMNCLTSHWDSGGLPCIVFITGMIVGKYSKNISLMTNKKIRLDALKRYHDFDP